MTFKKVVIAGGGVLGSQVAFHSAYCGFDVTLLLRSDASIERAKPKIERLKGIYLATMEQMKTDKTKYCRGFSKKTDLTNEEIDELKAKVEKAYKELKYTTSFEEACKDADLIIESIAEDPKQKTELYENLAKHMEEKTVLVTNSSSLLPSELADSTGRPEKYLAFHFANKIWFSNMVEIMGHPRTEKKYYDSMVEFAEQINMIPLKLKKEQKSYILNSMLTPFLKNGLTLWANDVADPETIDLTWKIATGSPVGPFEIIDLVGLETSYNVKMLNPDSLIPGSIDKKIADMLKAKIDAGETGILAGKGFYDYSKKK